MKRLGSRTFMFAIAAALAGPELGSAEGNQGGISAPSDEAQTAKPVQADLELGAYLGETCMTCHQGGNDHGLPSITNWPPQEFVSVMQAYKTKQRSNPVMQLMAGSLSDEEIAALAEYFASIP